MKLFGEILQCVDGYRAGKVYAFVDEVHAPRTDRREYVPTRPCLENVRRNHAPRIIRSACGARAMTASMLMRGHS